MMENQKELGKILNEYFVQNSGLKKKRSYWSTNCRKLGITEDVTLPTKIKISTIKCLKNKKLELSDKVQNFGNNPLTLFKKRQ